MYEDGENVTYKIGINWKDIAIKVILLILFLILLVSLFPKFNLDGLYDNIYTNNINSMKDSAKSYYTIDRLPESVGESKSMTLKEMIDDHMLVRFTDKDGEYCDESSSKVEVTKTADDKYVLKVQLTCGKQSDYILETIGCTNVCKNGECTIATTNGTSDTTSVSNSSNPSIPESDDSPLTDRTGITDIKSGGLTSTTIYYQHRQAINSTKTVYTCPEGYIKTGTKCYKETTGATIDAERHYSEDRTITVDAKINTGEDVTIYTDYIKTKTSTNYTCPEGYTLNGSYCIKYTDATLKIDETTYVCPEGYTLNGTKCTKTYDATRSSSSSTNYTCPNGGVLNGTKCTITTTTTTSYTCPAGYTLNGTSCYKVYTATSKTNYTCPNGGTLNGTKCTVTKDSSYNATPSTKTTYSCPNGGTLSGTVCKKSSTSTYSAKASTSYGNWVNQGTKYYTSAAEAYTGDTTKLVYIGAISGAVCGSPCNNSGIWYKYTYYTRSQNTSYSCPNGGTLSGSTCTVTKDSSYNATPSNKTTYSCPNGGTLSGTVCKKSSTSTYTATSKTTYSCPNGGTLNGNKCTITATSTPKYTCPSGYTQNGNSCVKTYEATKTSSSSTNYTCPNGGVLNGSKCIFTIEATEKKGESSYTCPAGYTLNGTKCEQTISATGTDVYTYTCPEGYTKTGEGENTKCFKVIKTQGNYYCEDANAVLNGDKCIITYKGEFTHYTCPPEYTLNGDKCTKTTTIYIDASVSTTSCTTYRYQWSTKSYIEGWEATGKTRSETSTYTAFQK